MFVGARIQSLGKNRKRIWLVLSEFLLNTYIGPLIKNLILCYINIKYHTLNSKKKLCYGETNHLALSKYKSNNCANLNIIFKRRQ